MADLIGTLEIRRTSVHDVRPLRERVLLPGTARTHLHYDDDASPDARHYAVWVDGTVVCCATLLPSEWDGRPAYQLRGMATDPALARRGLGQALLAFIAGDVARMPESPPLWCHAREAAVPFYERAGWRCVSPLFDIPGVGPHRTMFWPAAAEDGTCASDS